LTAFLSFGRLQPSFEAATLLRVKINLKSTKGVTHLKKILLVVTAVALFVSVSPVSAIDAGMKVATFNHNNGGGNDGSDGGRQDGDHGHKGKPKE
jgi:hypothetical protein